MLPPGARSQGAKMMIYVVCRSCGRHDLVPKCLNELELCFSCCMELPYEDKW